MLASILLSADFDPTIAVGGRLQLIESTARLGQGPWLVAEADESDGSFSRLRPEISIITNIDSDHLEHFGNFENIQKAFLGFAMNVPFYGAVIVYGDDPKTRDLFVGFNKRILFYGTGENNDYRLVPEDGGYGIYYEKKKLGSFQLKVPGLHNALNALAAAIAAHLAGATWTHCVTGLQSFSGVDRRFQKIGKTPQGTLIYDDYAHHPTEVKATLAGAREMFPDSKIHVIFQPHRYSRTRECWQDFMSSFHDADQTYVMDIYPAGEKPIQDISGSQFSDQMTTPSAYCKDEAVLLATLKSQLTDKDVVFTMGAGSVWQFGKKVLESLS